MTHKPQLSQKLSEEVALFMENTPPARINRNLRRLFMSYLMVYKDGHIFDMDDLLYDLSCLLELLDTIEDEIKQS